jgi:hypothetical protein
MISDATMSTLHAALSGLAQRQRVTADNIANVQTPGFLEVTSDLLKDAAGEGVPARGSARSALGTPRDQFVHLTGQDANVVAVVCLRCFCRRSPAFTAIRTPDCSMCA